MRLGIVANPNYPVPPFEGYGSTQRGVFDLSVGLAKHGHEITVVASGDSTVADHHQAIILMPMTDRAFSNHLDPKQEKLENFYVSAERVAIGALTRLVEDGCIDGINLRWERQSYSAYSSFGYCNGREYTKQLKTGKRRALIV